MDTFTSICQNIGVHIANEKSVGPCIILVFLGLEIDTKKKVIQIPLHKLEEVLQFLNLFIEKQEVRLREL